MNFNIFCCEITAEKTYTYFRIQGININCNTVITVILFNDLAILVTFS